LQKSFPPNPLSKNYSETRFARFPVGATLRGCPLTQRENRAYQQQRVKRTLPAAPRDFEFFVELFSKKVRGVRGGSPEVFN